MGCDSTYFSMSLANMSADDQCDVRDLMAAAYHK